MRHHTGAQSRVLALLVLLGLLVPTLAFAESVELVTYYPAPAAATETPPTKPYTLTIQVPDVNATMVVYDVYSILQLWRYGVARSQVTLVDYNLMVELARDFWGVVGWYRSKLSNPKRISMVENGVMYLSSGDGGQMYQSDAPIPRGSALEITVTW